MCRLLIYKGTSPVQLSHVRVLFQYTVVLTSPQLLTRPAHSIINQAFDSRLRVDLRRPINGDGFGVGASSGFPIKGGQVASSLDRLV
jgi:glutamine amidotransferase